MATIRKRQLKNGGNAYTVQVKLKDKGSGKTILETTTWRPDAKMTAKQEQYKPLRKNLRAKSKQP